MNIHDSNKHKPPKRPLLDVMNEQARARRYAAQAAQAAPPNVLDSQLRQEYAFRKILQQMRDKRNGN